MNARPNAVSHLLAILFRERSRTPHLSEARARQRKGVNWRLVAVANGPVFVARASIPRLGGPKGGSRLHEGLRYPRNLLQARNSLSPDMPGVLVCHGRRIVSSTLIPRTLGVRQIQPVDWHGDAQVWVGHPGVSGSPVSFRFPTEFLQAPWPLGLLPLCALLLEPELLCVW